MTTGGGSTGHPAGRPAGTPDEWYADGLAFECTQCGNCCTGPPGMVWFTKAEGRRLADAVGLSETEFYRLYARREGDRWTLIERETEHGFDCVLLDRAHADGGGRCSVYGSRPSQCRTWPFWPENVRTRRTWETVKRVTPCPGMNQGAIVPVEQIRILRDAEDGHWLEEG